MKDKSKPTEASSTSIPDIAEDLFGAAAADEMYGVRDDASGRYGSRSNANGGSAFDDDHLEDGVIRPRTGPVEEHDDDFAEDYPVDRLWGLQLGSRSSEDGSYSDWDDHAFAGSSEIAEAVEVLLDTSEHAGEASVEQPATDAERATPGEPASTV